MLMRVPQGIYEFPNFGRVLASLWSGVRVRVKVRVRSNFGRVVADLWSGERHSQLCRCRWKACAIVCSQASLCERSSSCRRRLDLKYGI